MNPDYASTLQRLLGLQVQAGGKSMTLDSTRHLNRAFGSPDDTYAIVHVAGTNGKGSVVTKISKALQASGYKVGTYTSPHLACFRERVQVNGSMISEEAAQQILLEGFAHCTEQGIVPSFFELTTCMAFKHFANSGIDIAVVEVGLGGRLDATNIVSPVSTTITSIGLEHVSILGTTREAIAFEKAGIIKPGIPVIVGPQANLEIIESTAHCYECPYITVGGKFTDYDSENSATARATLEVLHGLFRIPQAAIDYSMSCRPPCRLEHVHTSPDVILDVAHNPDGISRLMESLAAIHPNRTLQIVCGFAKEKDVSECLKHLAQKAKFLHLVAAQHARALPLNSLALAARQACLPPYSYAVYDSIAEGISQAKQDASALGCMVVICGSFFLMKEARESLGLLQVVDPFDLNETSLPLAAPSPHLSLL